MGHALDPPVVCVKSEKALHDGEVKAVGRQAAEPLLKDWLW
jgi:hypothetical protein